MKSLQDVRLLQWKPLAGPNGSLVPVEAGKEISYGLKRLFYVYGVKPGEVRGRHAHRECQQTLVCLKGKCEVTCDDGREKRQFLLDSPTMALYIPPTVWAEQKYLTGEEILLVLTDQFYNESDYIRDYAEFKEFRGESGL
jgi:dTDP-4-dehydrorhamnose 3,5-epimerase-like enzyme